MEVFSTFRSRHTLTEDITIADFLYLVLGISLLPKLKRAMVGEKGKEESVLYFFVQHYIFHEWYFKPVRA